VHALDTERRTAVCIDLDGVGGGVWGATLQLHGPTLDVVGRRGTVLARIDTRSHRLLGRPVARAGQSEDAGTSWLPMLAPTAVLAVMLVLARRRRAVRTA